ncbi:MAG: twin transmembrane helix small protein [Proteobacteria bacterium]|nr:twin transmembrane helix small protein [Pseudomonadota bacterium]MCH8134836.1 twin transmembrane helix small protein [Pseudomonadota bacterium]
MFDLLVILVMLGILVSLAFGLYFLVKDRGKTNRAVISLSIRVGLAVLLLIILAFGFMTR